MNAREYAMNKSNRARCGALALILASTVCAATTPVRMDLPQLVRAADLIVDGTVASAETLWIGNEIYTRYTVQIAETLHGEVRDTVPVLVMGGIDFNRPHPIGMAVAGAPTFQPQERVLLLLQRGATPALGRDFLVAGFNQGRFTLAGSRTAVPTAAATSFGTARASAQALEPAAARELKARVRELIHTSDAENRAPRALQERRP
jgi:hypothetical protein